MQCLFGIEMGGGQQGGQTNCDMGLYESARLSQSWRGLCIVSELDAPVD